MRTHFFIFFEADIETWGKAPAIVLAAWQKEWRLGPWGGCPSTLLERPQHSANPSQDTATHTEAGTENSEMKDFIGYKLSSKITGENNLHRFELWSFGKIMDKWGKKISQSTFSKLEQIFSKEEFPQRLCYLWIIYANKNKRNISIWRT